MRTLGNSLYRGEVVHVRVAPKRHVLSLKVFNLYLDVDELDGLSRRLRLFSYNRFNVFSINDRKWGSAGAKPIALQVRALAEEAMGAGSAKKIFMLCFPAVLGRVFNPLTTYYCFGEDQTLQCMVFEVSNTFGQRHSYVVPAAIAAQKHAKRFHVSPFNKVEGAYSFHVSAPDEKLRLSISLHGDDGLKLNTWFTGARKPLTDWELAKAFLRMPLMPLQILGAIHWQAVRLWWKGLVLQPTPAPPAHPHTISPLNRKARAP
jgi:uncharacterized protein